MQVIDTNLTSHSTSLRVSKINIVRMLPHFLSGSNMINKWSNRNWKYRTSFLKLNDLCIYICTIKPKTNVRFYLYLKTHVRRSVFRRGMLGSKFPIKGPKGLSCPRSHDLSILLLLRHVTPRIHALPDLMIMQYFDQKRIFFSQRVQKSLNLPLTPPNTCTCYLRYSVFRVYLSL